MPNGYTNAYTTTLDGAINNSVTSIVVIDSPPSGLTVPFSIRIKAEGANTNEICTVTAIGGTGNKTWTVTRASEAWNGTQSASSHANGATVEQNLTAGTLSSLWVAPTAFIGAKVYHSTTQSIGTGAETTLSFDSESYDTDGFHSTSSNTNRITIPAGLGGKYHVTANIVWATNTNGYRFTYLKKNGSTYIAEDQSPPDTGVGYAINTISVDLDLVAGDYIELRVTQNTGGNLNVTTGNNNDSPMFSIYKLDSGKIGQGIGAGAYNSSTQSINSGAWTSLTLDSERFDTDAFHSVSSNTSRFTIPSGLDGIYLLRGQASFAANSTGGRYIRFYKNGATILQSVDNHIASSGSVVSMLSLSSIVQLNSGDYIELQGFQDSGGALNTGVSTDYYSTAVEIARLDSGSRKELASAAYKRATGDYTTTSSSFVDVDGTNMALTINTGARRVLIGFTGSVYNSGTVSIAMDFTVDGTRVGGDWGLQVWNINHANQAIPISFTFLTDILTAGSHTFKVQWKTSGGTATIEGAATGGSFAQFYVMEQGG